MSKFVGHQTGFNKVKSAVLHCADRGIKYISIFAFSTENWDREQSEIDAIFEIVRDGMHDAKSEFIRYNIRVVTSGDTTRFPKDLQESLANIIEKTSANTKCTLNICINYGGRAEIIRATNKILNSGVKNIGEEEFSRHLYTANLPDPDLVVRTSGENRISNFLLWQIAYAELVFIPEYWPSMNKKLLDNCLLEFQNRSRRFGKV